MSIDETRAAVAYGHDYWGDDLDTEQTIISALIRLSDHVRTFALESCRFVSVGGQSRAQCVPPPELDELRWHVVVAGGLDETVVAHELAHAWLGHRTGLGDGAAAQERQVCQLVNGWGLVGLGADKPPTT